MSTFTAALRPLLRAPAPSLITAPTKRYTSGGGWMKIRSTSNRPRVFHSPRTALLPRHTFHIP